MFFHCFMYIKNKTMYIFQFVFHSLIQQIQLEVLNFLEGEGWADAFRNQDDGDAEYDELDGATGDNDNDDVQDSSNES